MPAYFQRAPSSHSSKGGTDFVQDQGQGNTSHKDKNTKAFNIESLEVF